MGNRIVLLKDLIAQIHAGQSPNRKDHPARINQWGILKTSAIQWSGYFPEQNLETLDDFDVRPQQKILKGDILITKAGPINRVGVVCLVEEDSQNLLPSGKMAVLRINSEIVTARYLTYLLSKQNFRSYIRRISTGMADSQMNFTHDSLLKFPINLPSVSEQTDIESRIDPLSDSISALKQKSGKIAAIRQAALSSVFQNGLENRGSQQTKFGPVPSTWRKTSFKEIIKTGPQNGYSPEEADTFTGTYMLGLGCLTKHGFQPLQLKNAPSSDTKIYKFILKPGDFLISRSNTRPTVGLSGVYNCIGLPTIYPDLMMKIVFKSEVNPKFVSIALNNSSLKRVVSNYAQGTSESMVKLNSEIVKSLVIYLPSIETQNRIVKIDEDFGAHLDSINLKIRKLESIKKAAIERLIEAT